MPWAKRAIESVFGATSCSSSERSRQPSDSSFGPGAAALPVVYRFSRIAVPVVAMLALTGLALAVVQLEKPAALVETRYGLILSFKQDMTRAASEGEIESRERKSGIDEPADQMRAAHAPAFHIGAALVGIG